MGRSPNRPTCSSTRRRRRTSTPVLVDGRILKRNGKLTAKLTAIDAGKLIDEASAATQAIKQRANWK